MPPRISCVPNVNRSGKLYHAALRRRPRVSQGVPNVNRSGTLYHVKIQTSPKPIQIIPNVNRSGKLYHVDQAVARRRHRSPERQPLGQALSRGSCPDTSARRRRPKRQPLWQALSQLRVATEREQASRTSTARASSITAKGIVRSTHRLVSRTSTARASSITRRKAPTPALYSRPERQPLGQALSQPRGIDQVSAVAVPNVNRSDKLYHTLYIQAK